jgi:predicted nucleic acid-binding protein
MIAVDTNLLVYAHRARTREHAAARRAIERAAAHAAGWGLPLPVLAEFWAVVTHPSAAGRPSTGAPRRPASCGRWWSRGGRSCGRPGPASRFAC